MMAEATTTAAVCVATGAVVTPFCAAFGFDPNLLLGGLVGGLIGCTIVQTLLPTKEEVRLRRLALLTVGSVLLSTISTLLVAPSVVRTFSLAEVPPGAVRLAVGALIGGFAQPIAVQLQKLVLRYLDPSTKESGNA
jgi:hypothetical protein